MAEYAKPLPQRLPDTSAFWEAAERHEIALQTCADCATVRHPPGPLCPSCHSWQFRWQVFPGEGTVVSWTVVHHVVYPAFAADAPYVVARVALDDCPSVLLTTNLIAIDPGRIELGMPVTAHFEDVTTEVTLIKFRPR